MVINIPYTLQVEDFRFVKLKDGKRPFETDWQNTGNYKYNDPILIDWVSKGNNYGVVCGYGNLVVIDADTVELRDKIEKVMPKTFTVKTGGGGSHFYYICDDFKKKIVLTKGDKHYGEVQSTGSQVVAPSCVHNNGNIYEVICNGGITKIRKEEILGAVFEFEDKKKKEINDIKRENKEFDNICITDVIDTSGMKRGNGGEFYGSHPVHDSKTGMNFYVNDSDNVWHCFRCGSGGGALQWIAVNEGIIQCHESQRGCLKGDKFKKVLKLAKEKYGLKIDLPRASLEYSFEDAMNTFNDFINLSVSFVEKQPLYYDNNKIWWAWDFEEYKWKMVDEVDIMIMIDKSLKTKARTTSASIKSEIIESLKRTARGNAPSMIKDTWIQFKDKIIDIDNGEEIEATSQFFSTNPVDIVIGDSTETPYMDKLFTEWVGEEYVDMLYEIIAYSLSPTYFLHRVFCFVGSGNNGKSTFFNIIKQFAGTENVTSTELDDLLNCRFEKAKLFKKLICFMGETNFGVMKKTSILKKLTGQDLIGYEFKNKNPFDDINYAKIFIATNTIPITYDKTKGFYRRWIIVDFHNDFEGKERDVISEIPMEEWNNLAKKSVELLKKLRKNKKFTNEGTIDQKMQRFEEKSNPMLAFIKNECNVATFNEMPFWLYVESFNAYLIKNNHRQWTKYEISKMLKEEGFELEKHNIQKLNGLKSTQNFIIGLKTHDYTGDEND